jgi:hypothetical protein
MTLDDTPQGHVKVNLAMQVAGIAAQVSAALGSGNAENRQELADKLALAQGQLQQGQAPDGLVPFIDVMCAMLRGEDASARANKLQAAFRAVYDRLVQETQAQQDPMVGDLTVRQVLDQVAHNAVLVMKQGSYAQQRMMANTLLRMQQESATRPDLEALVHFLEAVGALLQDEDWAPPASRLQGPFQAKWEEILNQLQGWRSPQA